MDKLFLKRRISLFKVLELLEIPARVKRKKKCSLEKFYKIGFERDFLSSTKFHF